MIGAMRRRGCATAVGLVVLAIEATTICSARAATNVDEIVVTAQKREESLQKVPISMSVLTGEKLDEARFSGLTEALQGVPGVAINVNFQGGGSGSQVGIRGVNAGNALANGSSPVSYYLDSVPFGFVRNAFAPDFSVYDLQRVEILRGPQGTLYGANAQNGVVRVITHDPDLDKFEVKARASASLTEGGGENYRTDLAVNVPIVQDKLAARAVVGFHDQSGWIDRPNKKDANDSEIKNYRLKIAARPIEDLSLVAAAWVSRSDFGGPPLGNEHDRNIALKDESSADELGIYSLKARYSLPWFDIESTTGHLSYRQDGNLDYIVFGLPSTLQLATFKAEVLSQEVLLTSTHDGPWKWHVGGIYRDAEDQQYQNRNGFTSPLDLLYKSKSYAFYGELTRSLFDDMVELTGGLRYFKDDVKHTENSRLNAPTATLVDSSGSFDSVTPRIVLTWHPSEQASYYASYSEGFRSGFPQAGSLLAIASFPPVEPDLLKNYEVGTKGRLWDNRINYDLAVYYIDWDDVQQSLTVSPPAPAVGIYVAPINAGSASGFGFDIGATIEPVDRLRFSVAFSWNDLKMDSDVVTTGIALFSKGDRLNYSPEITGGLSVEYSFPIGGDGLLGHVAASGNYTSPMDFRTIQGSRFIGRGNGILLTNASFSIEPSDGRWTATLFGENLNNEDGTPVAFPVPLIQTWDARLRPRTYGVQVELHF